MTPEQVLELLTALQRGEATPREVLARLTHLPYEDLDFAKIDHHRPLRTGLPEVIYGEGKSDAQVAEIFARMAAKGGDVLATRVSPGAGAAVLETVPGAAYHAIARLVTLRQRERRPRDGTLAVLCAGTSDLPVAEEAAITAEMLGNTVARVYDVGVAGLHRLLAQREVLGRARVIIACAGDGGRAADGRGRAGARAGHRRADQRGLRRGLRRRGGAAGDAQLVRAQCRGGQYRQRLRRGLLCHGDTQERQRRPVTVAQN